MSIATTAHSIIQLLEVNHVVNFADLFKLNLSNIKTDWHGKFLNFNFEFCLIKDAQFLYFACQSNADTCPKPNSSAGLFVEGLWEYTVCELFIGVKNSSSYREINLAPNGAWWACDFSDYRKRSSNTLEQLPVKTYSNIKDDGFWQCAIRMPLSCHNIDLMTCNVTAIIVNQEETFLSAYSDINVAPDFHLDYLRKTPQLLAILP